jgi:hypothetical protein
LDKKGDGKVLPVVLVDHQQGARVEYQQEVPVVPVDPPQEARAVSLADLEVRVVPAALVVLVVLVVLVDLVEEHPLRRMQCSHTKLRQEVFRKMSSQHHSTILQIPFLLYSPFAVF